jgi:hypothetical protein
MRAIVVYESMYGNTHTVAAAIGRGLEPAATVTVVPVSHADRTLLDGADLVVVGGPTHGHTMSRGSTREAAVQAAHKPASGLTLEPDTPGEGVREWLAALKGTGGRAAAFDTRVNWSPILTGRASKAIAKALGQHGFMLVAEPESFLVTKENELLPDEEARAQAWGAQLATTIATARA